MKNGTLLFILVFSMISIGALAQKKPNNHKIVFQFTNATDTLQQKAIVNQLKNMTTHWPNAKYEVVIHSMGLPLVMSAKSKQIEAIKALRAKGVRFLVCENTMKSQKVTKDQLIPEIEYVPVGIAEIVEKQEQGWSYIKGGF
ncbi:DsrE family protein [Flavobacterium sp. XS2P24]|uniref:DsrE family protein n=1 Tax=Flavobacterium sp. XS2P24 TaxID=3041249 RepID=UPI0024A9ECAC|nr:DsrE family protein [Flavobacterium sp. XS2P24]MDI6050193.1 DsrE family protein [Flavobacterium sp. XS2P24]